MYILYRMLSAPHHTLVWRAVTEGSTVHFKLNDMFNQQSLHH